MKQGVTVVIPSFTCKDNLFRLLDSLKKTKYSPLEIVVVDNGSKDNTLSDGRKKYRSVIWVDAGEKNIGQTGCYNLGFAYANKRNHIAMIDSDVVVESGTIGNLVERLDSDKKIGIVTPMILYLSNHNWVNQAGSYVDLTTGRVQVGWGPKKKFLEAKEVQNSGTMMLFSRSVVNKIGGFDDWFLCYFDPDYCLRAKKAGYTMWYEPKAICYHDQSKNPKVWRPRVLTRAYLLGRNRVLFMRKFGNMLTFSVVLPALLGYYFIECMRYGGMKKFFDLCRGSIVGYFYPLNRDLYIPLPKVKN